MGSSRANPPSRDAQLDFGIDDLRRPEMHAARLADRREQYATNEHEREDRRKRHARAKERHSANHRAWYLANREARIEADRQWRAANPDKALALSRRRNYKRRYGLTDEAIEYADVLRYDPCCYCSATVEHIDHIDPLAKGGSNDWSNLTGACQSCNGSKGDTPLLRFLLRR